MTTQSGGLDRVTARTAAQLVDRHSRRRALRGGRRARFLGHGDGRFQAHPEEPQIVGPKVVLFHLKFRGHVCEHQTKLIRSWRWHWSLQSADATARAGQQRADWPHPTAAPAQLK